LGTRDGSEKNFLIQLTRLVFDPDYIDVHQMPGTPIHTLKDLLLPNEQDTRVILRAVTEGQETPKTHSLSLSTWDPERLPPSAHLFEDLPSRMQEHLGVLIDQCFSDQAARTSFTNCSGRTFTPDDVLGDLREHCMAWTFDLSNEGATQLIVGPLSYQVIVIYEALTGDWLNVRIGEYTSDRSVITDRVFRLDDGTKILWREKSSRAFDRFIGELMEQMRDRSPVELCTEPVATTYRGYKAILGKVRVCPVKRLLSESCLSPAWVPRERHSALDPLGNYIQRTPVCYHLHPTHTRKTSSILLVGDAVLSSAG
jgi:hypothetical protein